MSVLYVYMSTTNESTSDSADSYTTTQLKPYKDEDILKELYVEKDLSQYQIADQYDVSQPTISVWLDRYGIEKPDSAFHRCVKSDGRINLVSPNDDERAVNVSQVVALQDFHGKDVFADDTHVHHLIGSPFVLDLPENLEVWKRSQHVKRHAQGTATDDPETVLRHTFNEFSSGSNDNEDALKWKLNEGPPKHCLNSNMGGYDG